MITGPDLDALVAKEFPMKTEEENGAITRIIGEVVASNEMEREFLNYKLKIIAKFEVDEYVELANHEFKTMSKGRRN